MARQAAAARAERGAHRQFLPARGGAGQHEVGDVGAGQCYQRQHGTEQQPGGEFHIVNLPVAQAAHHQPHFALQLRRHVTAHAVGKQRQHLLARGLRGGTILQTGESAQENGGPGRARDAFVQLLGQQYVGLAQLRHLEGPRQKTDDAYRGIIQADCLPDGAGIAAETRLPHGIGEQGHFGSAGPVVLGVEIAAGGGDYAKRGEKVRLHLNAGDAQRRRLAEVALAARIHRGHGGGGVLVDAPVQVSVADIEFAGVDWSAEAERHEAIGARIGEAAE